MKLQMLRSHQLLGIDFVTKAKIKFVSQETTIEESKLVGSCKRVRQAESLRVVVSNYRNKSRKRLILPFVN